MDCLHLFLVIVTNVFERASLLPFLSWFFKFSWLYFLNWKYFPYLTVSSITTGHYSHVNLLVGLCWCQHICAVPEGIPCNPINLHHVILIICDILHINELLRVFAMAWNLFTVPMTLLSTSGYAPNWLLLLSFKLFSIQLWGTWHLIAELVNELINIINVVF